MSRKKETICKDIIHIIPIRKTIPAARLCHLIYRFIFMYIDIKMLYMYMYKLLH